MHIESNRLRVTVPTLLVGLELEKSPRVWLIAESAEDEARLLDWLSSSSAVQQLEGVVLEALAELRTTV